MKDLPEMIVQVIYFTTEISKEISLVASLTLPQAVACPMFVYIRSFHELKIPLHYFHQMLSPVQISPVIIFHGDDFSPGA